MQPPQRESPFLGLIFLLREKGGGERETAWLHGSHIICLSASLFLSASCVLAKERESTNQSVPTTQRCGYVIFNHKAEQSSTAWNVERQQPTTSSNTHSQKRSFSSGSCFINSRLDFFFSYFSFFVFFRTRVMYFMSLSSLNHVSSCENLQYNLPRRPTLSLTVFLVVRTHYIYGIISFNLRQQGLWTVLDETRAFLLCKPTPTVYKIYPRIYVERINAIETVRIFSLRIRLHPAYCIN